MEHLSPKTDHALMREIYRAYLDELSAILDYTENAILLHPYFPTVAALLQEISEDEMHHFVVLGEMLRDHGISPAVDTRIRQASLPLAGKSPDQIAKIAQGVLEKSLADERSADANYRRLAAWSREDAMRRAFGEIAEDEQRHAEALTTLLARLDRS
jgi:bacterioferritin (cytochrome b1)